MLKKYWKNIVLSAAILSVSALVGNYLRGIELSMETYRSIASNPIFIAISVFPLIGCLALGFVIARNNYDKE